MSGNTQEAVKDLNQLLRGEISAAETYKMAIDRAGKSDSARPEAEQLHALQREHGTNAQQIRERIEALGGEASDSSGAWGAFAEAVQKTANLFGDTASLKALKEGEEHGLHSFERKLRDGHLDEESAAIVQAMIPRQKQHIAAVHSLLHSG